jgi:type II secretory pathway pseudopilin PulG
MTPALARRGERGFALLVVMLLAAAIAFALYTQVPRFAFESMREREQLLMDRGNQYKRAIQVFYSVNKRYPSKLEDLENTNDKRFLRRRYKDPMTGKDEWRIVHTNGSALTDSLVQKPPAQNAANGTPGAGVLPGGGPLGTNNMNSFNALAAPGQTGVADGAVNSNGVPQPVAVNPAAQRRPSDRVNTPMPTPAPAQNPQDPNFTAGLYPPNFNPNDPSTWPAITLAPVNPQNGGQQTGGQQNAGLPGLPFQGGQNVQPGQPLGIPGFGGQNGQPVTQISAQPFGQQNPFDPQASLQNSAAGGQPSNGQPVTPLPFGPQANSSGDGSNSLVQPNPVPVQAPSGIPGQGPGQGGFNPQPTQIFNPGLSFAHAFWQSAGARKCRGRGLSRAAQSGDTGDQQSVIQSHDADARSRHREWGQRTKCAGTQWTRYASRPWNRGGGEHL